MISQGGRPYSLVSRDYSQNLSHLLLAHGARQILTHHFRGTLHAEEIVATRHQRGHDFGLTASNAVLLLLSGHNVVVNRVVVVVCHVSIRRRRMRAENSARAVDTARIAIIGSRRCQSAHRGTGGANGSAARG